MKSILIMILSMPALLVAQSDLELTTSHFQQSPSFMTTNVVAVEKIFSDEYLEEDLYKVTFCAPTKASESCQPEAQLCEYTFVDTTYSVFSGENIVSTGVSCDKDLEEVLDPQLIDEL